MIQITAQMRVLVAIEPVDGRKGIDSLVRLCQDKLAEAELKIQQLEKNAAGEMKLKPLSSESSED